MAEESYEEEEELEKVECPIDGTIVTYKECDKCGYHDCPQRLWKKG